MLGGGDAEDAGLNVSNGDNTVIGFWNEDNGYDPIPSGCGDLVLMNLNDGHLATHLSNIIVAGSDGVNLGFSYYELNPGELFCDCGELFDDPDYYPGILICSENEEDAESTGVSCEEGVSRQGICANFCGHEACGGYCG